MPDDTEDFALDPEDANARAETAFADADTYEFGGRKLTFAWEHETAAARVGIRLTPGDVMDFLYLLSLPGDDVVLLRTRERIEAFYLASAAWARQLRMRVGSPAHTEAMNLAVKIIKDAEVTKVEPRPPKEKARGQKDKPPKN